MRIGRLEWSDEDRKLAEEFMAEFSDYVSTQPPGAEESFGVYALRSDMSLQTIFETWKSYRHMDATIEHEPVSAQGRAEVKRRADQPKEWWMS